MNSCDHDRNKNNGRAIFIAVVPAAILPLIASLFYFVWMSDTTFASTIYFATKIFTLIWPLLAWKLILGRKVRLEFDLSSWRAALPLGLISGVAVSLALFALLQSDLGQLVDQAAPAIRRKATQMGFLDHYWSFAVFLSLFHSLIEEYYWRWFLYGRLREVWGKAPATLVASLAFAAHHIVVASQYFPLAWGIAFGLVVGLGGAFWCWLYERQRTLFGAWMSHMIIDFAIMIIGWRLLAG